MYKVKLTKDCVYGKAGKVVNPMDKSSYLYLYKQGFIEDDLNLVKEKKEKKVKIETNTKDKKEDNKKDNNFKNK